MTHCHCHTDQHVRHFFRLLDNGDNQPVEIFIPDPDHYPAFAQSLDVHPFFPFRFAACIR
jgi:hypothetical protein